MRLKNKVFLSLCMLWVVFLCVIYIGTHTYFFNRVLQIQGWQDNQDVIINRYAISHLISHYLAAFFLVSLLFGVLGWRLLRSVFLSHWNNFNNQLLTIYETSDDVGRIKLDEKDELYFAARQFNHMMDDIQRLRKELINESDKANQLYKKISVLEQHAAKADKADSVFHYVGDFLNGIATSSYVVRERIENSKAGRLTDVAKLLIQQQDNLGTFMMQNVKGQNIPVYLDMIAKTWSEENEHLLKELVLLDKNLAEIKNAIRCFDKETVQ